MIGAETPSEREIKPMCVTVIQIWTYFITCWLSFGYLNPSFNTFLARS